MRNVTSAELERLIEDLGELPELDLSLHAELPKLLSPWLDCFLDAFADDDPDAAEERFAVLLKAIDTPLERARLARGVIALRARARLDRKLAAAALIPELEALKERRRRSGLDRLDEVWEGVLHMVPAPGHAHAQVAQELAEWLGPLARQAGLEPTVHEFNLGESENDFRVPDGGLHRPGAGGLWHPPAALVVEIVSPGDESWQKLPFYAGCQVDEVLIVDSTERAVHWLALAGDQYHAADRSELIDLGPAELADRIEWPRSRASEGHAQRSRANPVRRHAAPSWA